MISPEVGVTIIEGDKQKTGGKDYLKHFKKYSKYDYTKLVVNKYLYFYKYTKYLKTLPKKIKHKTAKIKKKQQTKICKNFFC